MTGMRPRRPIQAPAVLPGRLFLIVLALCAGAGDLGAHGRTVSYSYWEATPAGWDVRVRLPVLELDRRFGPGRWDPETARALALDRFGVSSPAGPCTPVWSGAAVEEDEYVAAWSVSCPRPASSLTLGAFFDTAPSHLHYARVREAGSTLERVATAAETRVPLTAPPRPAGLLSAAASGVAAFFSGPAPALCLAGLILLAFPARVAARTAAAFVLAGAVSGVLLSLVPIRVVPRTVEALVGLSVLVPAVELFARHSPPDRAAGWRLALGAVLLSSAAAALLGWLAVAPAAVLGMALVASSLQGLDRAGTRGLLSCVLAAGLGLVHGAGISLSLERLAPGLVRGSGILAPLGYHLGAAGAAVAAALLAVGLAWLLRAADRTRRSRPFPAEQAVAALLTAAGTWGFLHPAMGPF